MDRMTLGVEEAACRILERLGHKLTDAEVDYEAFAGMHNFIINHAGTRFGVQFAASGLASVDERHPLHIESAYPSRCPGNRVDRE